MRVFKDTQNANARVTFADLGVTWMSEDAMAARGLVEVNEYYQSPINESQLLSSKKLIKQTIIKKKLAETDYKALKYSADKVLTEEEYSSTKAYRESLRASYSKIEAASSVAEVELITIPTEE